MKKNRKREDQDYYYEVDMHKPGAAGFKKCDAKTNLEIPTGSPLARAHQIFLDNKARRKK